MNGSNTREYKNGIYVAPDGRRYIINGDQSDLLPNFGLNENGILVYKYTPSQEEHDFIVSDNHTLDSELENLYIDSDGYLVYNISWSEISDPETMAKHLRLLRQHNKIIRLKVTLLGNNYEEVESITGKIKGAPSYEIDSESDIRRTCALTLSIPSKEQIQLDFEKTWNDRMVELSCGIYSWEDKEFVWYKLGRMLMVSGSTMYNATTQEVKLNLVDLMAAMTQERGSQIGVETLIPVDSTVDGAIIAIVTTYSPFKRYNVCSFEDTVPYDLTTNIGSYPIDMLRGVFDLFPYYEFFYNTDGVFIAQQIPTKINDPVDVGHDILDDLIISEKRDVDFSEIKNTTEIHGRELTGDYIATACTLDGTSYKVTISESFATLVEGETYTVIPSDDSVSGQTMNIQNLGEYPVVTVNGAGTTYTPIAAGEMKENVPYVIRYSQEQFVLQGEMTIRCIIQEVVEEPSARAKDAYKRDNNCDNIQWIVNPDSPYACTLDSSTGNIEGEKKQVLDGGEYSAIYTAQLAYERASYENWKACRMQDTVEIEMILVPWMDVNDKIEYTSPVSGEIGTWLVKNISYDFNTWTMTVKASRFYPYYPWL